MQRQAAFLLVLKSRFFIQERHYYALMRAAIFLVPAVIFLFLGVVFADGGIMPPLPYYKTVFAPEQKAAVFWDGSVERMILSTKITATDFTGMAWVIPIQSSSKPEVKQADNSIFFGLAQLFEKPRYHSSGGGILGAGSTPEGVEIVQAQKIGIYDLTTLKANDANSLLNWLNGNNYYFPENKKSVLDYYIRKGNYYFIANKINLPGKYPGIAAGEKEKKCAENIVVGEDAYYGRWQEQMEYEINSAVQWQYNENPDCNGADFNGVKSLVELGNGIATPLEFSFRPEKPFYPMAISGINNGNTTADVYIFGGQCFEDSSQLLEFKNAVQDTELGKEYGFGNAKCISFLEYKGANSSLVKDSFFTEKPFLPEYDPHYAPPGAEPNIFELIICFVTELFLGYC
ncbi:MAG: DUF2330 domain-containing protein [Candidatus ainarchaeum sp.]|nr:DUF2330 domain-containing protein [Candidatus ainarchaeum sp.]